MQVNVLVEAAERAAANQAAADKAAAASRAAQKAAADKVAPERAAAEKAAAERAVAERAAAEKAAAERAVAEKAAAEKAAAEKAAAEKAAAEKAAAKKAAAEKAAAERAVAQKAAAQKAAAERAKVLRAQELASITRYPSPGRVRVGNNLMVVSDSGELVDVEVIAFDAATNVAIVEPVHDGQQTRSQIDLTRTPHTNFNFIDGTAEFMESRDGYLKRVEQSRCKMQDAITGVDVDTADKLIKLTIDMGVDADGRPNIAPQNADYVCVTDIAQLASMTSSDVPAPVFFLAPAGTGKSWSAAQLLYLLAKNGKLSAANAPPAAPSLLAVSAAPPPASSKRPIVPFLVTVQELAKMSKHRAAAKLDQQTVASNVVLSFLSNLRAVITDEQSDLDLPSSAMLTGDDWALLNAAYHLRLLVVIVDGIDEVRCYPQKRDAIHGSQRT